MDKKKVSIVHNLDKIGPIYFMFDLGKKDFNIWDLATTFLPDFIIGGY
jgi:hypothetical protein